MSKPVVPYEQQNASKKAQVTDMFDNIAPSYDLLNRMMTLGIDVGWRRKAIRKLKAFAPKVVLDMATGTADFAIEARKLAPEKIIGLDISRKMIDIGKAKIKARKLEHLIELRIGDAENIDLPDHSVDAITIGFGVRNFENLEQGLRELLRVMKPGGAMVILEPSYPTRFPLKQLFFAYFKFIVPLIGKGISGDASAYTYLPESVAAFPNGKDFVDICRNVGFRQATYYPLTLGVCSMYLVES